MDPIVSPTGQRVLSHPGEVSPFGPHSQPSVFSWVSMRVYVCFPANVYMSVFLCKCMYVLMCVYADLSPRQLLFLIVHFHLACDVTQPDTTTWACEACHKLICKLVVFYHISSLLSLKVFPYVGSSVWPRLYCVHVWVGGWVYTPEMACPNLYLCACGQINTDYHNQIWLWHDIAVQPTLFHRSQQIHSSLAPLWIQPRLRRAYIQWVSTPCFRRPGPRGKSGFNNYVREKTHPAKMAAALYTVQLAMQQPEKEGWDWNPSKSKSDFFPDLLLQRDSM